MQAGSTAYTAEDSILLVGDGDFSFARGLVRHRSTGEKLIATSFDSKATVLHKYGQKVCCTADTLAVPHSSHPAQRPPCRQSVPPPQMSPLPHAQLSDPTAAQCSAT